MKKYITAHDHAVNIIAEMCNFNGIKTQKEVLLKSLIAASTNVEDNRRLDLIFKFPNQSNTGFIALH